MTWQRVSVTLLTSSILALAAVIATPAVRGDDKPADKLADKPKEPIGAPADAPKAGPVLSSVDAGGCGAPCGSPCGPTWTTIKVTEYVPTTVKEKRTVLKPITTTETYTAWKTECVEEAQTRTCTINKMVPVVVNETRCIHKCVPTVETRVVTKCIPVCKTVTEMCSKTVDKGHWECREEICGPSFFSKLKSKLSHDSCECSEPCPTVKTKKVWVACLVTEQYPVTKTIKSHETISETVQMTVNKTVTETVVVPVTTYKCVPEVKTEVVKVLVPKQVSFQATRQVTKCVPVEEEVLVTKCLPVVVEKKVAVSCAAPACDECGGGRHKSFSFGGFLTKFHKSCGCGCE
jgi:hypothetical protein